jgi:threonylcarbamoyladenosine tRNA methylthiotransferase MtaB
MPGPAPAELSVREKGTVSALAVGCRANQEEIDCLLSRLGEAGYRIVPFGEPADWVVVNTCTVTAAGDSDSRQMVRRGARLAGGRLLVTGCLAQRDPGQVAEIPGVERVLGNAEKSSLFEYIESEGTAASGLAPAGRAPDGGSDGASGGAQIAVAADPTVDSFPEYGRSRAGRRGRAAIKVQEGCEERCTYCIVPSVRGRSRSRSLENTLRQARCLAGSGFREIVLTGINTALWGRDLPGGPALPDLLSALAAVSGLERVRVSSLEPQYVTLDWLDQMAASALLCRHLHLPLQSGDPLVLRRMGRRCGPIQYADLVTSARLRMPDVAIGCDLLVGFPGETEDSFEATFRLISGLPLAYLHVFSFSPRPGTPGIRLDRPVGEAEKRARSRRLRELDRELRHRFASQQIGTVQTVLPEAPAGAEFWQGLTGNYVRVRFPWAGRSDGPLPRVRLEAVEDDGLMRGETLPASPLPPASIERTTA